MTTNHISDDAIEAALDQHSLPNITFSEVRTILADIQQSLTDYWAEHLDTIDEGDLEIVHEDQNIIVLADHTGYGWNEELDAAIVEDDVHRTVIKSIHHKVAAEHTDYSWSASDPLVFGKSEEWQTAELHARRSIAKLARESGSVARGVDRWATERQGLTLKKWGDENIGTDRPHQTISKNARRGREEAERQS
jgi:hypothetical protein